MQKKLLEMDTIMHFSLLPIVLNIYLVEIAAKLMIGLNITKKIARYVIVVELFINVVLVLNHLLHRNQTIVLMVIAVNINIVI